MVVFACKTNIHSTRTDCLVFLFISVWAFDNILLNIDGFNVIFFFLHVGHFASTAVKTGDTRAGEGR